MDATGRENHTNHPSGVPCRSLSTAPRSLSCDLGTPFTRFESLPFSEQLAHILAAVEDLEARLNRLG